MREIYSMPNDESTYFTASLALAVTSQPLAASSKPKIKVGKL